VRRAYIVVGITGLCIAAAIAALGGDWRITFEKTSKGFVCLSDDNSRALIVCDNEYQIWDLLTGGQISALPKGGRILCFAFSNDGRKCAIGAEDGTGKIFDVETGKELSGIKEDGRIISQIAFLRNDSQLMTVSDGSIGIKMEPISQVDSVFKIWDLETGNSVQSFSIKNARYLRVMLSPDEKTFLTCHSGENGVLRLLELGSGKELRTYRGLQKYSICLTQFSPDGKYIISNVGGETHLWETETENLVHHVKGHLLSVWWSDKESVFATSPMDRTNAIIYDLKTGSVLNTFAHGNTPVICAFSPDGKRLAVGGAEEDQTVTIWDSITGKLLSRVKAPVSVVGIELSDDPKWMLTISDDGENDPPRRMTLRVWKGK
jgi:WD40 repeat protein